jgi:hypothetical protein
MLANAGIFIGIVAWGRAIPVTRLPNFLHRPLHANSCPEYEDVFGHELGALLSNSYNGLAALVSVLSFKLITVRSSSNSSGAYIESSSSAENRTSLSDPPWSCL